jgi:hypothetical protein
MRRSFALSSLCLGLLSGVSACSHTTSNNAVVEPSSTSNAASVLDERARDYVRIVLALGEHDPDFVDAYYGPAELREEAKAEAKDLARIRVAAEALAHELRAMPDEDEWQVLRRNYLTRQLGSLIARIDLLQGKKLPFDQESLAIYDAISPSLDASHFDTLLQKLESELAGEGTLTDRFEAFRKQFEIPRDKLAQVIDRAIAGCRERTMTHVKLPEGERFTVEYVTDKPWGGYNWYKGNYESLIQINTSLPIHIDRAIDLACHEGYPGHHVYNVLLEEQLVRGRGFVELTVYPLFSSQSLIAEGSANFGIDLAFPGDTRAEWEKEHLFPLAGIDPSLAERYYRVLGLTQKLSYASNIAAQRYLDGQMTQEEAIEFLSRTMLTSRERAEQRIRFIDKYRAYVINYNLGKDLVKQHIESVSAGDDTARWRAFSELLSQPTLPSDLSGR